MTKRLSNYALGIGLSLAVLVSLVLSWLIWTNNAKYQQGLTANSNVQSFGRRHLAATKKISEVFAPTEVIVTDSQQQRLIYNYRSSGSGEILKVLQKARMGPLHRVSEQDQNRYLELLHRHHTLQLSYPTTVTLSTFLQAIGKQNILRPQTDQKLNRVILTLNKDSSTQELYFLDDHRYTVHKLKVRSLDYQRLNQLWQHNNFTAPVEIKMINHNLRINYLKPVKLHPVSYLVVKASDSTYLANLLSSSSGTEITTHKTGKENVYRKENKMLTVDRETGVVVFNDYSKFTLATTTSEIFNKAYQSLKQISNPLNSLYLFNYDASEHRLSFRDYVEGFPIFHSNKAGSTEVSFANGSQTLRFSNRVLQAPVPAEQKTIELPATTTVLQQLQAVGYSSSQIQNLTLGYSWNNDLENKDVVDLMPSYYVKINDQWKSYQDWLK
ncbi:hypothetical protein HU830_05140 [Lactobacillus sp. DCY120]|uniref:Regulatory protein YycH domain-containing protein n=1 Tax=Bombilactobacillus apium TaxID=2675299 RepID=A0A850R2H7_9LACO|nr:two-component system activity regulator YycH [Bombilactobacillus apium]NVY96550.1 hypothetical protein [Bombilactobacillus apium]